MIPTVSILLSAYNAERFLEEALESLLGQRFRNFECIAVNDGSSDGTAEMLDRAAARDHRFRIVHQRNSGLIASLNAAAALAQGKYLARMDADDISLPERLQRQVDFLDTHPKIALLGGAVEFIDSSGKSLGHSSSPTEHEEIFVDLLDRNPFWHPTVMMRREAFFACGGYRNVLAAEDYDLWLRMAERFELANLSDEIVRYRVHSEQITGKQNLQMTVSALSCRASAFARRSGASDPLSDVQHVTDETLMHLIQSVSEIVCERFAYKPSPTDFEILRSYFRWLYQAAELSPTCRIASFEALALFRRRDLCRQIRGEAHLAAVRHHALKGDRLGMLGALGSAVACAPQLISRVAIPTQGMRRHRDPRKG